MNGFLLFKTNAVIPCFICKEEFPAYSTFKMPDRHGEYCKKHRDIIIKSDLEGTLYFGERKQ